MRLAHLEEAMLQQLLDEIQRWEANMNRTDTDRIVQVGELYSSTDGKSTGECEW